MTHLSHHYTYSEQHVCSGGKSIWISNKHLQNIFFLVVVSFSQKWNHLVENLHVEIQTFWSTTIYLLKSILLIAILNTKLNKFIWKWVFVLKNVYLTCFHLKKYHLKSYSILVMSLSQSLRSESYPIYNLCRNNVW